MGKTQLYFSRRKYSTYLNTSEHSTYGLHRSGSWGYPQHETMAEKRLLAGGESDGATTETFGSGPVKRYSAKRRIT